MGGKALAIPMDILKEQDVIDAVKTAIDAYGHIDILVNNSGIGGPTAYVWDLKLDEWNEIIGVDLTGSMLAAREVLKHMVPAGNGGIIINVGAEGGRSGDGRSGYPMRAGYCCAKMGVIGLTETLARECGPHGIRVNCISAGAVRGPRFVRVMQGRADARGISLEEQIKTRDEAVLARPSHRRVRIGTDRGLPGLRRIQRHHRPDHRRRLRHEHVGLGEGEMPDANTSKTAGSRGRQETW